MQAVLCLGMEALLCSEKSCCCKNAVLHSPGKRNSKKMCLREKACRVDSSVLLSQGMVAVEMWMATTGSQAGLMTSSTSRAIASVRFSSCVKGA